MGSPSQTQKDSSSRDQTYQVLARKYRLKTFEDMIGQSSLVRILTNGITSGHLPHGFLLTGIRGVGKTTTARIIARALNCVGADGKGGPAPSPCGVCEHCKAIDEDRHMDVIEMDAASRTGIEDVREVIEAVRYKAVSARYKIYIIDEVHMLSKSAFNALLKTLEEPPPHVKFIFATTEVRRVPDTVLSRCMRFDLSRVSVEDLGTYFAKILSKEGAKGDKTALALIGKAADGSVRDGLSLLDQALALSPEYITEEAVRKMLHLSEHSKILTLFNHLVEGRVPEALEVYDHLYQQGADVLMLLHQVLEVTGLISTAKANPQGTDLLTLDKKDQELILKRAEDLSMGVLVRFWQVLLKGIQEVQVAPFAFQAGQMILIRLGYLSPLPTPSQVLESLKEAPTKTPAKGPLKTSVEAPKPLAAPLETPTCPAPQAKKVETPAPKEEMYDKLASDRMVKKAVEVFPGAKVHTSLPPRG